ncbi:MAG: HAD family phosphatase [Candidatus Saccharimonadales bacterium]
MKKFAVFDIDGTLIRWQLYHAVVDRLAGQGLLQPQAKQQLRQARMSWKQRQQPDSFKIYEESLIEIFESALGHLTTQDFDRAVQSITEEYSDQVYTYTRDLIKDLKAQDYTLLAISGSHQELVAIIAQHYGFTDWRGTVYERDGHQFSGKKQVASQNKRAILQELMASHNLTFPGSLAVGDSVSDAPMLEMVEQPIAFNPDRQLFDIAKAHGWKMVIERKNMIYRLESHDGRYLLA